MNDIFQCGDSAALVAYLYDECASDEHALITAHLKGCATCASEIDGLTATRRTLATWTPPELALGFRITREDERSAKILEPRIAWWRAPLPAWAQAAAALVIFGAGLSVGMVRTTTPAETVAPKTESAVQLAPQPVASNVSRDELAQLEQKIKSEIAQIRSSPNTATPIVTRGSDDALIAQVKSLIEESEANQRKDFTLRMVELAGNIENQRRVDMASVRQQIGLQQGAIGTELRQQREVLGRLVSERTR
jgi:hypothetical protein